MPGFLKITIVAGLAAILASCATPTVSERPGGRIQKVRTTAYTNNEGTGGCNAIGRRLSGGPIKSAASDWSRFPLGTRFRVLSTGEEYVIDDYGGALVGTNTIDLYATSRRAMHRWGVRHVDIEILRWGSEQESLQILRPRHRVGRVRRMIASLENHQRR